MFSTYCADSSGWRTGPNKANYVSHPGERFNALNKPAKASGRRQGLRSTGSGLACSTFLLFFDSWPLMRRPGDATVTFLVLGSCECWVTIFRVAGGRGGCGGVSLSTLAVGAAGSASIASRTYPVSSLSASVNVSCGTPETTVVWSRYVSTCGGRDAAVPALATIAVRPSEQTTTTPTILITADPSSRAAWFDVSLGWIQAVKGQARKRGVKLQKLFVVQLSNSEPRSAVRTLSRIWGCHC
jgi:hypothetical protein